MSSLTPVKFEFEGTITVELATNHRVEVPGILETNDSSYCKLILFKDSLEEKIKQKLILHLSMKRSTLNPYFNIILHGHIDYVTKCDSRYVYSDGDKLIISNIELITSESMFCNENINIMRCSFLLESNSNFRKQLRKSISITTDNFKMKDFGNQFTRIIDITFNSPTPVQDVQQLINSIVQTRTFIDGFQNYESNVRFDSGDGLEFYYYLSRKKNKKYRCYNESRYAIDSPELYLELIKTVFHYRQSNEAAKLMLDVVEFLHTNDFRQTQSLFLQLVTTLEGFLKTKIQLNDSKDEIWHDLKKNIKGIIKNSEYSSKIKKQIINNIHMLNPSSGKLRKSIRIIFIHCEKSILGNSLNEEDVNDLIGQIVSVRHQLAHNPSEYFTGTMIASGKLTYITILLREMIIYYMLTAESVNNNTWSTDSQVDQINKLLSKIVDKDMSCAQFLP